MYFSELCLLLYVVRKALQDTLCSRSTYFPELRLLLYLEKYARRSHVYFCTSALLKRMYILLTWKEETRQVKDYYVLSMIIVVSYVLNSNAFSSLGSESKWRSAYRAPNKATLKNQVLILNLKKFELLSHTWFPSRYPSHWSQVKSYK